jgi:hypothetical protein
MTKCCVTCSLSLMCRSGGVDKVAFCRKTRYAWRILTAGSSYLEIVTALHRVPRACPCANPCNHVSLANGGDLATQCVVCFVKRERPELTFVTSKMCRKSGKRV